MSVSSNKSAGRLAGNDGIRLISAANPSLLKESFLNTSDTSSSDSASDEESEDEKMKLTKLSTSNPDEESEDEKRRLDKLASSHNSERSQLEIQSLELAKLAMEAAERIPFLNSNGKENKSVLLQHGQDDIPLTLAPAPKDEEQYPHIMRFAEFTLKPHNFQALCSVSDGVELVVSFYKQRSFYKPFRKVLKHDMWKKIDRSFVQLLDGLDCISDRNLAFNIANKTIAQIDDFHHADKHIRERLLKMLHVVGVGSNPTSQGNPQSYLISTFLLRQKLFRKT